MSRSLWQRVAVAVVMLCALLGPVAAHSAAAQADTLTCDDFTNQDAAQIVLDLDDSFEETLDEDGDGEACPDLPARDDDNNGGNGSDADLELLLGSDQADVEDVLGEPEDDADADDFTIGTEYAGVGDFDTINIFWINDTAAHIHAELSEELVLDDAYDLALGFLPSDVDAETEGDLLDDDAALFLGESDEVADLFVEEDYEDNEVGGAPGDVRIILIPGDEDIAAIDVAIGTGDEYVPAGGNGDDPDPDPTEEPTEEAGGDADAEEYLETVRDSHTAMVADLATFLDLIARADSWTDADVTEFTDILIRWATLESEAAALEVPEGFEDVQAAYEDAATALFNASVNFTTGLTESDQAALEAGFEDLTTASTALDELDTLLTDAGV